MYYTYTYSCLQILGDPQKLHILYIFRNFKCLKIKHLIVPCDTMDLVAAVSILKSHTKFSKIHSIVIIRSKSSSEWTFPKMYRKTFVSVIMSTFSVPRPSIRLEREKERERARECVCACACVCARAHLHMRVCMCVRVCACVCTYKIFFKSQLDSPRI